jgi:N-acetylgalactosamine-N,N'-diacetylbacillosaminyl-diphospho-undecaprenol 4-alpha-N-acetylgalactosaminyltransferase
MSKVTFLINSFSSGGAEKVLSILSSELVKENYKVEIIFLEKNEFYHLPKKVKKTYLSNFDGTQSGIIKLIQMPFLAYKLSKYIKKNNITIVQSHIFRANYINVLAKLFGSNHKAQVVTTGRVSRYLEQGLLGKVNLFLISSLYKRADLIISKAQGMENDMQKLFNFSNFKEVINNPYDIKKIRELKDEEVKDFNFRKDKLYLISVGRLIKLKRNNDLIEALNLLDKKYEILFVGHGEEKDNLEKLAKELNLERRVHFIGQVNNPYKYIAKCDFFINCSESEGFPNVLVEAMICGVPVISSDCVSGPREILAPDTDISFKLEKDFEVAENGLLFPVGDVKSLVKSIMTIEDNINLKNQILVNASKRVNDFSLKNILEKYKKVLEVE